MLMCLQSYQPKVNQGNGMLRGKTMAVSSIKSLSFARTIVIILMRSVGWEYPIIMCMYLS